MKRSTFVALHIALTLYGLFVGIIFGKWRNARAESEEWKALYQRCKAQP